MQLSNILTPKPGNRRLVLELSSSPNMCSTLYFKTGSPNILSDTTGPLEQPFALFFA